MVTQEDVELAYQEAMMNMARLNRTGIGAGGLVFAGVGQTRNILGFVATYSLGCVDPPPLVQFLKYVKKPHILGWRNRLWARLGPYCRPSCIGTWFGVLDRQWESRYTVCS